MTRLAAAVAALVALAQIGPLPGTGPLPFSLSGYQGPGDVLAGATFFLSCQFAYSAAVAAPGTNKSCNLRRASDSHTCDVLLGSAGSWTKTTGCSTGGDNGTAVATWCTATTCSVTEAYDQTGNGLHFLQATAAKQPAITFNGVGANAVMTLAAASSQVLAATFGSPQVQIPTTVTAVFKNTKGSQSVIGGASNGQTQLGTGIVANNAYMFSGTVQEISGVADNAYHAGVFVFIAASTSFFNVDGTDGSVGSPGGNSNWTAAMLVGSDVDPAGNYFTGSIGELAMWGSVTANATLRGNLCHNQFVRWGTPTAC